MALNPTALEAAAQASVFNQLKLEFEDDIPSDLDAASTAQITENWTRTANAVAKAMPDIINEFLANAQIQVTVPPGTFLIGAQQWSIKCPDFPKVAMGRIVLATQALED